MYALKTINRTELLANTVVKDTGYSIFDTFLKDDMQIGEWQQITRVERASRGEDNSHRGHNLTC